MDIIDLGKSGRFRTNGRLSALGRNSGKKGIYTRIVMMQKCVERRNDVFARRRIGELIAELVAVPET